MNKSTTQREKHKTREEIVIGNKDSDIAKQLRIDYGFTIQHEERPHQK